MLKPNKVSKEEGSYDSEECQIDTESERWTTLQKCKGGTMHRVWDSTPTHLQYNQECYGYESEPPSDIPSGVDLNNNRHHPSLELDIDLSDCSQTKLQRLATPNFTLKPKTVKSLENCCTASIQPQNIPNSEPKPQIRKSFTETRSVSCLTRSKVDCSSFCNTDDNSPNTRVYQISTEVHRSTKRLSEAKPQGEGFNDDLRTQDRVLEWLNTDTIHDEGAAGILYNKMERSGDSALEDDINAANNSIVEKYVKVTTIKSSTVKGEMEEESVYHQKELSVQGVGNGVSSQVIHHVKPEGPQPFIVPLFDPSVMSTVKETVKSFCVKEGQKNQIVHTSTNSLGQRSDQQKMPLNFKDISFHYQTKDKDFEELTPTGFSINFDYPSTTVKQKSSLGIASTYFPGSKIKSSDPESETVSPTPKYLLEFLGKTEENNEDDATGCNYGAYQVETLKPPTPCTTTSIGDISMVPLVHSEATIGSLSPSQRVLVDGGCFSDQGLLSHHGVPGEGRRRRGPLAKKRPGTKELADFGRRILNFVEQQNDNNENLPPLPPLFPSRLPTKNPDVHHETSDFSNEYLTNDTEEGWSEQKIVDGLVRQTLNRYPGRRNILHGNMENGTTREVRPSSRSEDCFLPPPHDDEGFWSTWKESFQPKTPTGVSKVAAWKRGCIGNISSNNALSAKSSQKSLASQRSSRHSSRNFVKENIDKINKASAVLKMPREERPPLPKDERVSKADVSDSKTKASGTVLPKKTLKAKVKELETVLSVQKPSASLEPSIEINGSGVLNSTEKTKLKNKKAKVKNGSGAQKLDPPVAVPDPYYALATASEKELIVELVKADVDALLERDATANTSKFSRENASSQHKQIGAALSGEILPYTTPKHAAHWAHGNLSSPAQFGYPFPESALAKPKRPVHGGKSSGKKPTAFGMPDATTAGSSGFNKKADTKVKQVGIKPKPKKQ